MAILSISIKTPCFIISESFRYTFWWEIPVVTSVEIIDQTPRAYLNELMGFTPEDDAQDSETSTYSMTEKILMLVDDNKDLLDFLREALCSEFAEIITVTSGNKALATLSSGKLPDIIVSDINCRMVTAINCATRLRKAPSMGISLSYCLPHVAKIVVRATAIEWEQTHSCPSHLR